MAMPVGVEEEMRDDMLLDNDEQDPLFQAALSQQSNYSVFGDADISGVIAAYATQSANSSGSCSSDSNLEQRKGSDLSTLTAPATQSAVTEPPDSSSSEDSLLGKRKATEGLASSRTGPFRPVKQQRSIIPGDDGNPFLDKEAGLIPENPFSPISISPVKHLQRKFDVQKLPYGVQYEIARYVCAGKLNYKDIMYEWVDELADMKTNQDAVPALRKIISGTSFEVDDDGDFFDVRFAKEQAAKSPWIELDREEEARDLNPLGGLGFNERGESLDWHGGKVLFHGKLQDSTPSGSKIPTFKLVLEPAELGPSNMFARRFGSRHFFRLKLHRNVVNKQSDHLLDYLRRPLILCGSVFRAFYAKESNVFYVKTNELTDGVSVDNSGTVEGVKSFLEFLHWHNPIESNENQTMAKYVSRFALGLSNSVPGLVIEQKDIKFIKDIESKTGSNMTDGAGKINRWSLNQIRHRLDWEDRPTAIQTRIFGTKGLLVDDGKHAEESPYVELTPSQRKIQYPKDEEMDLAHRIIDVLRFSHTKTPCRLSVETIINLADNGVKRDAFLQLLQTSLSELIEPLLDWESQDAMLRLWCNVRRQGGVMGARRAREAAGLARVMGYSDKDVDETELEDEDGFTLEDLTEERSTAWWADEISGCPSTLAETVMYLIDSGFKPRECPVLRDKLWYFIKGALKTYVTKYRIDVPMSASAFLVPDTSGILEPGEVYFRSSRRQFKNFDGLETDLIIGDVLLTRHPCKLPTDIQKWKSVDKPELYHLTDVIVCSTKGDRRAADFLSGGDYDGDKGTFIWQPELVAPFKNANLSFSEPPSGMQKFFKRENEQAKAFQTKIKNTSVENKIRQFQNHLLGAVRDSTVVGKYSTYHEYATYMKGYKHPETIRLAYMFCMVLDGIKTGLTVSSETLKQDANLYKKRPPVWKETEEETKNFPGNEAHPKRPRSLGRFIMDDLYRQANDESRTWHVKLDEHFLEKGPIILDQDLAQPWIKAQKLAKRYKDEKNCDGPLEDLKLIQAHVKSVYVIHRQEMAHSPRKGSPRKEKISFTDQPIEVRQDTIREISKKFASGPPLQKLLMEEEELARLRASYAYIYDYETSRKKFTRFPFDVAMRELCAIKARAQGRAKTVTGDFYDHFNIKHPKNHHS